MASVHGGSETTSTARRHQLRAPRSVNGGNGFVFIDHLGNICPSGFLPAPRGNIGSSDLATVYRTDEMFVRLRDANALSGKRGRCQFREICGCSRSRRCRDRSRDGIRSAVRVRPWPAIEPPVAHI
jgi:MoaA/NifB/PqqE/SkfB family radical SAM enzyme